MGDCPGCGESPQFGCVDHFPVVATLRKSGSYLQEHLCVMTIEAWEIEQQNKDGAIGEIRKLYRKEHITCNRKT